MKVENYGESSDKKSTGSMKKSKDRRYSEGSVESLDDLKQRQNTLISPAKDNELEDHQNIKFTKESPHKVQGEELEACQKSPR